MIEARRIDPPVRRDAVHTQVTAIGLDLAADGAAYSRLGVTMPRWPNNVSTPNAAKIIRHGRIGTE